MIGSKSSVGVDKIPMHAEFEQAFEEGTDLDKKIVKLAELTELAILILLINTNSFVKKFCLDWFEMQKVQIIPSEI